MGEPGRDTSPTAPGLTVVEDDEGWTLAVPWDLGAGLVMAVFAFLAVCTGAFTVSIGKYPMAVGFLAAAIALGYVAAAAFRNSTVIRIADGALTVTHGPMPWGRGLVLDAARVRDVVTEDYGPIGNPRWALRVDLQDGGRVRLVEVTQFVSLGRLQLAAPLIKQRLGLRLCDGSDDGSSDDEI